MFTCSLLFWHYFSFIRCLCWLSGKESTVWSSTSPTQKPRIGFWTKWTAYIVIWAWSMSSWKAVRKTFSRNRHRSGMNTSDSLRTWQRRSGTILLWPQEQGIWCNCWNNPDQSLNLPSRSWINILVGPKNWF